MGPKRCKQPHKTFGTIWKGGGGKSPKSLEFSSRGGVGVRGGDNDFLSYQIWYTCSLEGPDHIFCFVF